MCGITGFADFNKTSDVQVLKRMCDTISHRGPDGEGQFIDEAVNARVGLGHRRLSILDLSEAGAQPMRYRHLTVTFNGEIYNFAEIRKELVSHGHTFQTSCDTEVLLQAYARWGERCVARFIGMFAFVIYDSQNQTLFIARDRAGVKPLFYYKSDKLFLFGSELKSLCAHPGFTKETDPDALALYLQFGYVPGPYCIHKNCHKLAPASWMKLRLEDGAIESEKYWSVYDAYNRPKSAIAYEDAVTETELVLEKAFGYRMVADVPVGIFLSGGYDSACIAALLQKNATNKLRTFTIGVPDIGLNEAPFAKAVANHLGTDHTEYSCTETEALALIDRLPYYYDEPFGDSSAIPTMLVSEIARRSVTVALSGDGGDEIFAGYNRYEFLSRFGKLLRTVPAPVRKTMAALMSKFNPGTLPLLTSTHNFAGRYEKLQSLLENPSDKQMLRSVSTEFNSRELTELLKIPYRLLPTAHDQSHFSEKSYSQLAYMMAADYETYLVDDILQKVDRASMSFGLEAREPYLDQHVVEWVATLPDEFKLYRGEKKRLLKSIVHRHIPSSLMSRPKMGFAIPIARWLNGALRDKVEHYLNGQAIATDGVLNADTVSEIKSRFQSGRHEYAYKVWYLLMYRMWQEKNLR